MASAKPDYFPAHRQAQWLSSEDVRAAIVRVAMTRGDDAWRACCWDIDHEINLMLEGEGDGRS